jgi:hypothetical protein
MAEFALCAGVAINSSRVPRPWTNPDPPGMVSSLTKFESSVGREQSQPSCLHRSAEGGTTNMKAKIKDDLEDIPMAYLWYVIFTIMTMAIVAVLVVIQLF